jgi:hypothetical protein
VAAHTPDLTGSAFFLEQPQTAPAPRELDDIPALRAHVIELEYDESGIAAVRTVGAREQLPHILQVASLSLREARIAFDCVRIKPPGSVAHGSPNSVAVRTDNIARSELALESANRTSSANHVCDIAPLLS